MNCTKNLVFTITHGRNGTTFLTEVFKMFDDTMSVHEPEPNYANLLPSVKNDPRSSIDFLKKKISHIEEIKESNYIETSNVFGKAFFIPLLRLGIAPGILLLNRNFNQTAYSLFTRGSIPMRTTMGKHYSSDPTVPGSLPIHSPEKLSDYQLCYWGVLDAFSRQLQAAKIYDNEGLNNYQWVTANDFHDFNMCKRIGEHFGLVIDDEQQAKHKHSDTISIHHNPNNKSPNKGSQPDFFNEEVEVLDRIAFFDPDFVGAAADSGFIEKSVVKTLTG